MAQIIVITSSLIIAFAYSLVQANHLGDLPEDVIGVNRSQLNLDIFSVVKSMENIDNQQTDLQEYIRKLFLLTWRLPIVDMSEVHRYDSLKDKLISGGPKVNRTDCSDKLRYLLSRVTEEQSNGTSLVEHSSDYTLFNLLDSYGRPEGSFLRGAVNWLGDYDQCIKARYTYSGDSSAASTGSRYCLAHLRWPKWHTTAGFKEWKYTTVKSAICVPESCSSIEVEESENKQIISQLMDMNFAKTYRNFQIGDIYCLPDKESSLTQWTNDLPAIFVIAFFTIWGVILMLATFVDLLACEKTRASQANFIEVFSLVANAKKLFDMSRPDEDQASVKYRSKTTVQLSMKESNEEVHSKFLDQSKMPVMNNKNKLVDLNSLHCVKVILLLSVMKAHYFLFTTTLTRIQDLASSYEMFDKYHSPIVGMLLNNFFIITGLILSYLIFSRFPPFQLSQRLPEVTTELHNRNEKHKKSRTHPLTNPAVWIGLGTSRYLRLMPMLVMMTLVPKYLGKYLGSGPWWDYGTSTGTNSHHCREESWLLTFLAAVNLKTPYQTCIPSAWYLAMDMQFSIILAPIMIISYYKAPRMTFFASFIYPIVWSASNLMSDFYLHPLARNLTEYSTESLASFSIFAHEMINVYISSFLRSTFFFIGITAGYMLHIYETRDTCGDSVMFICRLVDSLRNPLLSNGFTLALVFMVTFIPLFISPHLKGIMSYVTDIAPFHVCLGVAVLLYTYLIPILLIQLSTGSLGSGSASKKFFNWPGWLPVSRISVSLMLVDSLIVFLYNARLKHTVILDFDTHTMIMVAQTVIIYIASFLVYLVLESPMRSCLMMIQRKLTLRYGSQLN